MRNPLIVKAIKKADYIRHELRLDMFEPISIFDACMSLGVDIRFVEINMEGMYISSDNSNNPTILISNKRPLPRRCFTCAHELGHHIFNHGTRLDALTDEVNSSSYNSDEFLVDAFAGALLMPIAGIQYEFQKRDWNTKDAAPLQFYIISSLFGVGYSTLIKHCSANKLIDSIKANSLLKSTPAKLLFHLLGANTRVTHFKIIDKDTPSSIIDLEVSNYLIVPEYIKVEGNHLNLFSVVDHGNVYIAKEPGVIRLVDSNRGASHFVRIQNSGYTGLAENRHLENLKY